MLHFRTILLILFIFSLLFNCNSTKHNSPSTDVETLKSQGEERIAYHKGKEIWFNSKVGTNGMNCESCHPGGEMTNAESYPKFKGILKKTVTISMTHNFAVVNENRGQPWVIGSDEANALVLFVTSLANGRSLRMGWPKKFRDECIARGKLLFSDPSIASTGRSCKSCHIEEGKKDHVTQDYKVNSLKGIAAQYPQYSFRQDKVVTLEQEISYCLDKYLNNKSLKLENDRIIALCCYITSLSEGKRINVYEEKFEKTN